MPKGSMAQRRRDFVGAIADLGGGNAIAHFFAWLICGAIVILTLCTFWMTFIPGLPFNPGWTLSNYSDVLTSSLFTEVLPNTLLVGFGTTAMALFFGIPLAWLLNRTDIPWRSLFVTMIAITVVMPGLVKAMGWIILLSPQVGLLNKLLINLTGSESVVLDVNSLAGIAFVQGLMLTPSLFFLISGPMRSFDPALEEAGQVVGANRFKILMRITSAVLWPAILGAAIYVFMTAIAMFEIAGILGGLSENKILATELFLAIQPSEQSSQIRYGIAGVYGVLIILPCLVALYYYFRSVKEAHRYATITGKGFRPKTFELGRLKYPALAFVWVYLSLSVFLPLLVLIWTSLLPSLRFPSRSAISLLSLRWYKDVFLLVGGYEVIGNTIVLVVTASASVLFFSVMLSWIVVRTNLKTRRVLDTIAMLPHAIPGLAFAFGLMIIGILLARWAPWLPLYNTVWIIVLANVMHSISYATRITNAAFVQVGKELEDAAIICGATKWTCFLRVMIPLISPSLVYAGVWTGLLVMREVGMALLLVGPRNKVLSTQIWVLWRQGNLAEASALSVVLVLIMALIILSVYQITGTLGQHRHERLVLGTSQA
jgi:iron(III) transport system permease protein